MPEAGYPLELIPPVPLPRRPNADLARLPVRLRRAVKAALEVLDRLRPAVVVGFGGYVCVPAYLAARRRRLPLVVHEGNALPGHRQQARCSLHHARRDQLPRHPAAARVVRRSPDPPDDLDGRPGRAARRGPAHVRARPRPPDAAGHRRLAGGPPAQPVRVGSRGRASWRPASRCCTSSGPKGEASVTREPGQPPYVVLPYVDRMDLAYAAADLVICRAGREHRHGGGRRRAARGVRAAADRQRRAGAQRPARRRGGRRTARARRRAHPASG